MLLSLNTAFILQLSDILKSLPSFLTVNAVVIPVHHLAGIDLQVVVPLPVILFLELLSEIAYVTLHIPLFYLQHAIFIYFIHLFQISFIAWNSL